MDRRPLWIRRVPLAVRQDVLAGALAGFAVLGLLLLAWRASLAVMEGTRAPTSATEMAMSLAGGTIAGGAVAALRGHLIRHYAQRRWIGTAYDTTGAVLLASLPAAIGLGPTFRLVHVLFVANLAVLGVLFAVLRRSIAARLGKPIPVPRRPRPTWGTAARITASVALVLVLLDLDVAGAGFLQVIDPVRSRSTPFPSDVPVPHEDVTLRTDDGIQLSAWFLPAELPTNRTLLVGHGYPADKRDALARVLFLRPIFNLFILDFRAFGESQGHYASLGAREHRDVAAAVAYLKARPEGAHIGAYGYSMSGAILLWAMHPQIDAYVADSAFARMDWLLEDWFGGLPSPLGRPVVATMGLYGQLLTGRSMAESGPLDRVRHANVPILLVHGGQDDSIRPRHAYQLYEQAPRELVELWIVDEAGHAWARFTQPEAYQARIGTFLTTHVGQGNA